MASFEERLARFLPQCRWVIIDARQSHGIPHAAADNREGIVQGARQARAGPGALGPSPQPRQHLRMAALTRSGGPAGVILVAFAACIATGSLTGGPDGPLWW
jgi:hypothetical protein